MMRAPDRVQVAVLFHRLGPYHHARLRALADRCRLTALELSGADNTYAWTRIEDAAGFARTTLFAAADVDDVARTQVLQRVRQALADLAPDVVAIPGWSHPAALAALLWCLRSRRPAVLMSDSTEQDEIRRPSVETIKRRVVRLYSAATVAGTPQRAYACSLGMLQDSIFCGYDVVDNDHFARGAQHARSDAARWRKRLGLPRRFFLACSRLIAKKNLVRLLEAYALYRACAAVTPWHLVILGDGDLRPALMRRIDDLGIAEAVLLPGFKQYAELPVWYGLADAFVHASTSEQWGLVVNEAMAAGLPVLVSERCGCVPDLLRPRVNGFSFDPHDSKQLADLMLEVSSNGCDRAAMGRAGQAIIRDWGPERFADGLAQAVEGALSRPLPEASRLDRSLLWALARR